MDCAHREATKVLSAPDRVGLEFCYWVTLAEMLVQDRGDVRFLHLRVPGSARVDNDGWPLLTRAQAAGTGDQHLSRHIASLHQPHVEGHEDSGRPGGAARGLGMPGRAGVGADDD